ncbi:PREDICTED: transmembrane protein 196-like isoform X2 [Priapulus caudatus]|uniref:Transmembrane protein 196 n=1 Tax=Priapulus caudatus TaxID=37621 RepID=A0ABM1ESB7_PRICU|nr:PREDICTED: transmembrane protein 196-like isoform X2 [Priapulus caudatus]
MYKRVTTFINLVASLHTIMGIANIVIGVTAVSQIKMWTAHSGAPIWSGLFFAVSGITGFLCARKRTSCSITAFMFFCVGSLITTAISIQMLRLGLGEAIPPARNASWNVVIAGLVVTGLEGFVCIVSLFGGCHLAKQVKTDMMQQRREDSPYSIPVTEVTIESGDNFFNLSTI